MSKGSKPRPFSVTPEQYAKSYDRIFRKPVDALKGDGDTYEEKADLSEEMQLHQDKMEKR